MTGPSVVSASSYDSGGGVTAADGGGSSVRINEGDDVRVACAMIVRKQVNTMILRIWESLTEVNPTSYTKRQN